MTWEIVGRSRAYDSYAFDELWDGVAPAVPAAGER
jgi:hypothetical protein